VYLIIDLIFLNFYLFYFINFYIFLKIILLFKCNESLLDEILIMMFHQ